MTDSDKTQKLKEMLSILQNAKANEYDSKTLKLYDLHIKNTQELINKLATCSSNEIDILIFKYIETESITYGRSFLPNQNGEFAETSFWRLIKVLGY